jgi:hypothetical protein
LAQWRRKIQGARHSEGMFDILLGQIEWAQETQCIASPGFHLKHCDYFSRLAVQMQCREAEARQPNQESGREFFKKRAGLTESALPN